MVNQYMYENDVEIEYRLGKMNGRFVSMLSKEEYVDISRVLKNYDGWDKIDTTNIIDTFYTDGVRCSSDGNVIKKKVLKTTPYPLGNWTVRRAVSRETPQTTESSQIKYIRSK